MQTNQSNNSSEDSSSSIQVDENPRPQGGSRLDWRMDPTLSYSDWRIKIVHPSGIDVYHVHKCILAAGTHRSDYFTKLFETECRESAENCCTIQLDVSAAAAIPAMLDFMYELSSLQITSENVVVLHHLADYFGLSHLMWDCANFWKNDICVDNCNRYYTNAMLYQNDDVISSVQDFCAEGISDSSLIYVDFADGLLQTAPPLFWVGVLNKTKLHDDRSEFIVTICELHPDMDRPTFESLTHEDLLPQVSYYISGLELLRSERSIVDPDPSVLTSLQSRCLACLATSCNFPHIKATLQETCTPLFLVSLMEKWTRSFNQAQVDCVNMKEQRDKARLEKDAYAATLRKIKPLPDGSRHCNYFIRRSLDVTSTAVLPQSELSYAPPSRAPTLLMRTKMMQQWRHGRTRNNVAFRGLLAALVAKLKPARAAMADDQPRCDKVDDVQESTCYSMSSEQPSALLRMENMMLKELLSTTFDKSGQLTVQVKALQHDIVACASAYAKKCQEVRQLEDQIAKMQAKEGKVRLEYPVVPQVYQQRFQKQVGLRKVRVACSA